MTTSTLVILLGIASSITLIISALSVHRKRLLIFGIATGIIVATQYGLVSSWVGLTTLSIGLVWTILTLLSLKRPWLSHWGFIALFALLQFIAFTGLSNWEQMTPVSFIPLIGGVGGLIAITFKNMVYTKATLVGLGAMWLVYEFHSAIYGQMVGESLNLIANSVALATLLIARKNGIPFDQLEDIDTHLIEVITSNIQVVSQPNLHGTTIVRGAHPNSVGYSRRVEEYEKARVH